MKSMEKKEKIREYKANSGLQRKEPLARGDIWVKPTMSIEVRSRYHRKRSKNELRKMLDQI